MLKKLEEVIVGSGEVSGSIFTRVYENEKGYIYRVDGYLNSHFEVFFKKTTAICIDFNKRIFSDTEKKEIYPKSNDFGIWAWSVNNIEKGIEKLK